jgi:glycosyltransferase involved in cell wall biosynthesis
VVDISLIIPASPYSDNRDLQLLMESIGNQTMRNLEVLVVAESGEGLGLDSAPGVRLLCGLVKRGASAARNHAARISCAEILGFIDDDVVLDPRWCEHAVASFMDETVGGVSGQARVPLGLFRLNYVPRELMWVVGGSYWNNSKVERVPSAAGMNFCVRKEAFLEAGGYDEALGPVGDRPEAHDWLRLGAEEDDLAMRIQEKCKKTILFNPRMVVTHRLRRETVLPKGLVKRSLHVGHNRAYIHSKHPSARNLGDYLTLRSLVASTLRTILDLPRHPFLSWKKISFTSVVLFGLCLGYAIGLLHFSIGSRAPIGS